MTAARTVAGVAVAALVGLATACGGSDDGADDDDVASLDEGASEGTDVTTPTSTGPEDLEDALLAYTECMRDRGIDMPDPQIGPGGGGVAIDISGDAIDVQELEDAEEECGPLMRNAIGDLEIDPEQQAEMQAQMLEFAECMREHGIDMPDPEFGADGTVRVESRTLGEQRPADADGVEEAAEECGQDGMFMAAPPVGAATADGGD